MNFVRTNVHGIVMVIGRYSSKIAKFIQYIDIIMYVHPFPNGKLTNLGFILIFVSTSVKWMKTRLKKWHFEQIPSHLLMFRAITVLNNIVYAYISVKNAKCTIRGH